MKLYFAGAEAYTDVLLDNKAKILISYAAKDKFDKLNILDRFDDVFLDSGAFSAYTVGAKINLDEYIQYIKDHKVKTYANLDVIDDAEGSYKNYKYMVASGLKPIPVFHCGEDPKYLELYAKDCDYIGLGGVVQLKNELKKLKHFFDLSFSIVKDQAKIHGLGVNNWELLQRYPFYSVDATSWHNPHRYGQHFNYAEGRLKRIDGRKINLYRFQDKTEQLDTAIKELLKAEEYITELWKKRGITYE